MSRARDLANGVTTLAPLASPDFTGTVALTGTTLSLDNDQISGDKVSGGTIGAGTSFSGTVGSSATINTTDYCVAKLSSTQTLSDNAWAAVNLHRISDEDPYNWFDDTTKKFQPDKAGRYFVTLMLTIYTGTGVNLNEVSKCTVKKNDAQASSTGEVFSSVIDMRSSQGYNFTNTASGVIYLNGSTDYLYNVAFFRETGTGNGKIDSVPSRFSAFRIGN